MLNVNKGSTFCIFQLENWYIIGGYSSVSWKDNGGRVKDSNAFVCSITNKEKYELKNKSGYGVLHSNIFGPNFYDDGGNRCANVCIREKCLNRNDGIIVTSNSYNSSMKQLIGTESIFQLLLKLKDYEVYQVL